VIYKIKHGSYTNDSMMNDCLISIGDP